MNTKKNFFILLLSLSTANFLIAMEEDKSTNPPSTPFERACVADNVRLNHLYRAFKNGLIRFGDKTWQQHVPKKKSSTAPTIFMTNQEFIGLKSLCELWVKEKTRKNHKAYVAQFKKKAFIALSGIFALGGCFTLSPIISEFFNKPFSPELTSVLTIGGISVSAFSFFINHRAQTKSDITKHDTLEKNKYITAMHTLMSNMESEPVEKVLPDIQKQKKGEISFDDYCNSSNKSHSLFRRLFKNEQLKYPNTKFEALQTRPSKTVHLTMEDTEFEKLVANSDSALEGINKKKKRLENSLNLLNKKDNILITLTGIGFGLTVGLAYFDEAIKPFINNEIAYNCLLIAGTVLSASCSLIGVFEQPRIEFLNEKIERLKRRIQRIETLKEIIKPQEKKSE